MNQDRRSTTPKNINLEIRNRFEETAVFARNLGFRGAALLLSARMRDADGSIPKPLIAMSSCQHENHVDRIWSSTWDTEFLRLRLFESDPIFRVCMMRTLPFAWSFTVGDRVLEGTKLALTASMSELLRHGVDKSRIGAGITVPLHHGAGAFGYLSFLASTESELPCRSKQDTGVYLEAGHRLFELALRHLDQGETADTLLNRREVDCLRLVALGRSLNEVAIATGLSYSTVRYHLRNAEHKLGAESRTHLLAKAAYAGLLGQLQ